MNNRWSIYIDIEGFSHQYEETDSALWALSELMRGIYLIGSRASFGDSGRIFAHQTGDGFIIVSEFASESFEIPIAIAVALMRHVAVSGRFAKATIAEGKFSDVAGCYPEEVRKVQDAGGRVPLGGGLMTVFPVMGTAMINAVNVAKASPSGALLTIHKEHRNRIPADCIVHTVEKASVLTIDWVHTEMGAISDIQSSSGIHTPSPAKLYQLFGSYFFTQNIKSEWKSNSNWFLSLRLAPNRT